MKKNFGINMTVEQLIKKLSMYPKDTVVEVHVYDMGNVESYPPDIDYYEYQNKIYISPKYDDE